MTAPAASKAAQARELPERFRDRHPPTLDPRPKRRLDRGMQVYVSKDGQQYGPYTVEQLRGYLAQGSFVPTDFACQAGSAEWVTVEQILQTLAPKETTWVLGWDDQKHDMTKVLGPYTNEQIEEYIEVGKRNIKARLMRWEYWGCADGKNWLHLSQILDPNEDRVYNRYRKVYQLGLSRSCPCPRCIREFGEGHDSQRKQPAFYDHWDSSSWGCVGFFVFMFVMWVVGIVVLVSRGTDSNTIFGFAIITPILALFCGRMVNWFE